MKTLRENDKKVFIENAYNILDNAIYGHLEAKTHILQLSVNG